MIVGVFSVVHHADDVRIREKLLPTLADDFDVEYHTRNPAPTKAGPFTWHLFRGSRILRNIALAYRLLTRRVDVAVLVDPETFVAGIIASRRIPIVFDIHENVPAQILTKNLPMRKFLAGLAARVLRMAERVGTVVLAEPGYASLFRRDHPVVENFPMWEAMPSLAASDGAVVYVGDITEQRGALDLVNAVGPTGLPLVMVGSCAPELASRLKSIAADHGGMIELTGRMAWPEAMTRLATAAVAVSPLTDIPNYRHSLPTKVLEYLGMGIPVVATRLPGTAEVVAGRPGVTLVAASNVAALRAAIVAAYNDDVRALAQAGAPMIRSEFLWPTERVRRLYAEVGGDPGLSPER